MPPNSGAYAVDALRDREDDCSGSKRPLEDAAVPLSVVSTKAKETPY